MNPYIIHVSYLNASEAKLLRLSAIQISVYFTLLVTVHATWAGLPFSVRPINSVGQTTLIA